ncbi:type I-C CRISPR-associated protein Cas5c [Desulfobulbus sp.]|uniref:type I-C CRISPR-associated protein Cas5c n=1 Tax=Desulfobulbus sp. TaxID=895 RepID=UPI00286FA34C|nr:type I-C CRISPR-associated protein Cas5c [Desulfobulbus sp.]
MRGFCLEVAGEFACFTRPEMKVERVSYDVITPSAARAIFDAILWKPAIFWRIHRIEVLRPIRWASIRRNEVAGVASPRSEGIFIEDARQQRAGLLLRDVQYRLYAEFEFIPPEKRAKVMNPVPEWLTDEVEREMYRQAEEAALRSDEKEAKYAAMFERRAQKGQCFNQPYLGCREFACSFRLVKNPGAEPGQPIADSRDLGFMLYDMDYSNSKDVKPMFFRAEMKNGVIMVPASDSPEVRR